MHILITGGTGFVGSALSAALHEAGHAVTVMTRTPRPDGDHARFVTAAAAIDSPLDAVINLAGASLADRRWSATYKRELRASRIDYTRDLGVALQAAGQTPRRFLSASAIGYYGAREHPVDESSDPGAGFAAQLCQDWEGAAAEAAQAVGAAGFCALRLGVVFDRGGGAYEQMAMPFRLRFGNWIGDGRQGLSWVHRHDVVAAIGFLLERDDLSGPFNLTAPQPTSSRGFCEAMQAVRPSLLKLPVPAAAMRLLMGEMADELLINGQQVLPRRLQEAGFTFRYADLVDALRDLEARHG